MVMLQYLVHVMIVGMVIVGPAYRFKEIVGTVLFALEDTI